jgi:hypothetical protein
MTTLVLDVRDKMVASTASRQRSAYLSIAATPYALQHLFLNAASSNVPTVLLAAP